MDSSTYRNAVGQIKNSSIIRHHNFPSHNFLSIETLNEISGNLDNPDEGKLDKNFLCSFPCYKPFDYSVEFNAPLCYGSGMVDVAVNIVNKKLRWEKKLKKIKVPNPKKAAEDLKKLEKGSLTKVSRNLDYLMRHFQNDPAPDFSGNYNWLYSGGNLVCKKLNNNFILISADYQQAGYNVWKLNDEINKTVNKVTFSLKTNSPVFQISANVNQDNIFALFRQRRSLNVFKINGFDVYTTANKLWSKKVNVDKFLTYCCVSEDCNRVVMADSVNDVHVYNLNDKKKIFGYSGKKILKDNWTQIISKDNTLYLADRNSLSTIDIRDISGHPNFLYNPLVDTNNCEDVCSITYCGSNSNYVYLGTTHNIIQVDLREKKSVQKWTHMMKLPPQFLHSIEDCSNDLLIVQSPKISETIGITNEYMKNGDSFNYFSKSLPCALSGIKNTLKFSRLNGLCLNPFIAERFDFAVTGIQVAQNDSNKIHLFISNSGGDIFLSKIIKRDSKLYDNQLSKLKTLESMKMYDNHFEEILPLKFVRKQQNEVKMGHIIEDFKKLKISNLKKKKLKFHWKYDEMFSEKSLEMYKDVLAQKILEVWGLHVKHGNENENDNDDDAIMSSRAKVQEWMEKI